MSQELSPWKVSVQGLAVVVAVVVAVTVIKQSIVTLNLFQGLPVGSFGRCAVSVFVPSFHLFTTKNGPLG